MSNYVTPSKSSHEQSSNAHEIASSLENAQRRLFVGLVASGGLIAALGIGVSALMKPAEFASAHGITSDVVQATGSSGTATVWTNSSLFSGPASQNISITNNIDSSTGVDTASFAPFTLTDKSTGRTINVSLQQGATASGKFDASTGSLTLNIPMLLQNVPVVGTLTTQITVSTENTITVPDGTQYAGKRLDASNNITLVGSMPFKVAFITSNAQMLITSVLTPAS